MPLHGAIISLSGFSGTGKSYLVDFMVRERHYQCCPYITNRQPRSCENHGTDRIFCTEMEFIERKNRGNILAQRRFGYWYGIDLDILEKFRLGSRMIFEIEYMYVKELKNILPECLSIYIWPDSIEHAIQKIRERLTGEYDLEQRLQQLYFTRS